MFSTKEVSSKFQENFIKIKYNDHHPVLKDFDDEYCILPESYQNYAKRIKDLKVRDDDIWILSYPKCGTTWTQELIWLMANEMDFESAKTIFTTDRVPFLEYSAIGFSGPDRIEIIENTSHRRIIKSHLPINLLPNELWKSKAKIVYVTRNPKDAAISYFHHSIGSKRFTGTLDVFLEKFLNGNILFGSYFHHVNQFWQLSKLKDNLLFITFEEMKMDMMKVLKKVDEFLETGHSEEKLRELEEYLKFENMKNIPASSRSYFSTVYPERFIKGFDFMRKGKVGSFKDEMHPDFQKRFDEELDKWNGLKDLFKNI